LKQFECTLFLVTLLNPFYSIQAKMPQCAAFTLQGVQCRRQAAANQTCCGQHVGLTAEEIERRRQIVPLRLQEEENRRAARARLQERLNGLLEQRAARAEAHAQLDRQIEQLLREAQEAQERVARAAGRLAARVQDAHGLGFNHAQPVHRDNQSVHRRDVNDAQKPVLAALLAKWPEHGLLVQNVVDIYNRTFPAPKKTFFQKLRGLFTMKPTGLPTEFAEVIAASVNTGRFGDYRLEVETADGKKKARIDLKTLIIYAMYAVSTAPIEHREPLRQRLIQEVEDGRGYCIPGRFARVLNAFAGFEEVVLGIAPVDPRSLNERLGDLFAALNRGQQTEDEKRAAAERILNENGVVEAAARAVWLEAL
jgi:hypothetical protein